MASDLIDCDMGTKQDSTLLLVGAVEDDYDCRSSIFGQLPWHTLRARDCQEALRVIHQDLARVVVSEHHLPDGDWRDVLGIAAARKDPPVVIVTSRLADECLWSEALNLGAYDVLAKPLDPIEVHRTISLAWQHWANQSGTAHKTYQAGK